MENNNEKEVSQPEVTELKPEPNTRSNVPAVLDVTSLNMVGSDDLTAVRIDTNTSVNDATEVDGFSIKQKKIIKHIDFINSCFWSESMLAIIRNVLYWCAVICIIILLANASDFSDWSHGRVAVVLIFLAAGLLGAGFHASFVWSELASTGHTSVLGSMLFNPISKEEFQQVLIQRQLSAPEIFFEVNVHSNKGSSYARWTSASRKMRKEMTYRGWADQSNSIQTLKWDPNKPSWFVVSKDFRCVDPQSQLTMDTEIAEFRRECGYDNHVMSFDLSLQWKEHDMCPDAENFLVFDGTRPQLYDELVYKVFLFFGLDGLYRFIFILFVKRMPTYSVLKFIEK